MNLSPLTLNGLAAHRSIVQAVPVTAEKPEKKQARAVMMYECPVCEELHDYRSDAEDCCTEDEDVSPTQRAAATTCPVCGEEHSESRVAADCCLWKDIDAITRWAMADQVEAGATWAKVLGLPDPTTGLLS